MRICGGLIVLIAVVMIFYYNKLVKLKQKTKNAWSQIEIQLQRRFDLIPNLIETVKGYEKHEEEVLEKMAEFRVSFADAQTVGDKLRAESGMSKAVNRVLAVAEGYPELKADQNFLALQAELKDTESKIAFARQFYNDVVTMYNTALEVFPSNIFAKIFGFQAETLFRAEDEETKANIKVQF